MFPRDIRGAHQKMGNVVELVVRFMMRLENEDELSYVFLQWVILDINHVFRNRVR